MDRHGLKRFSTRHQLEKVTLKLLFNPIIVITIDIYFVAYGHINATTVALTVVGCGLPKKAKHLTNVIDT